MNNVLFYRSMKSDITDCHGMEICIGKLSKTDYEELIKNIKDESYFKSRFFNSFSDFSSYYHKNGVFVYDDLFSISDTANISEGNFEFKEEDESYFKNILIPNDGIYLCSFRNESLAYCGTGTFTKKVTLHASVDEFQDIKKLTNLNIRILTDVFNGVTPLNRNSFEEEADGNIYDLVQLVFIDKKIVYCLCSNSEGLLEFPFDELDKSIPVIYCNNKN